MLMLGRSTLSPAVMEHSTATDTQRGVEAGHVDAHHVPTCGTYYQNWGRRSMSYIRVRNVVVACMASGSRSDMPKDDSLLRLYANSNLRSVHWK